jgi:hypothetical protein
MHLFINYYKSQMKKAQLMYLLNEVESKVNLFN